MNSPKPVSVPPPVDLDDSQVIAALAAYDRVLDQDDPGEHAKWKDRLANLPPAAAAARDSLELLHDAAASIRIDSVGVCAAPDDQQDDETLRQVLGDFRLLRPIGKGGMGSVYEAEQISLGRRVAVKVLPQAAALDGTRLARFLQEAHAAAGLRHPHIVPVFAVGCEQGMHFYAMQLIPGRSLAEVLEELRGSQTGRSATVPDRMRQPEWFDQVASLGVQAAEALQHAHERGIVHRDIKPANLLVDNDGTLCVVDFGLASTADSAGLTGTGDLLGTLRYASPEQVLGHRGLVDHRADVYSLGATLYELLTLVSPRPGASRPELLKGVVDGDAPPPRRRNPAIPPDLETIVLKALQTDKEDRYPTAAAQAKDLRQFLARAPIEARRPGWIERVSRRIRRHPRAAVALMSVLTASLVLLTGLTMLLNDARRDARQHASAALKMESQVREQRDAALRREHVLRRFRYVGDMQRAHSLIERGMCGDADGLLDAHVPNAGEADERDFAWHYLHALRHQDAGQMLDHQADVYFVDFSPDGNRLASASKDGAVRVWDYESRRLLHVLNGHTSEVNCVQYTPDGHLLISTGDDAAVRVWDADSGAPLATLSQHHAPVVGVSVHPDEQFMATGDAGGWVYVWDMAKRCVVQRTHAHPGCRIEAVEFSPDGQLMATCAYDGVRIWDVRDIPRIKILHLHGGNSRTVSCVGWSPDSEYLAAGNNDTVRIWEAWTGRETAQMSGPRQTPNSVCFSPDGAELAVASGGNKVWLWNPTNGQRLVTLHGHTIRLWCVRYALDGRSLATSDADGTIRTWDAEHARRLAGIAVENALDELAFTANGEALVTLGHDNGQLQLWDTEHRELRFTFPGQFSPGGFAELPAAKQLVTASREGRVDFWDLSPPEPVLLPPPMATRAQCVNVSPDGRRLACTGDALPVEVWDWERRLLLGRKLNLTGGAENRLHFSDDEEALVLQHPGGTWFWSLADGACRPFMGATQRASVIAPQRNLMYFGKPNGAITEQAVGSAIEQRVFWNQTGAITCLALSPDERFLVVGSDARVHFWDLETGWELFSAHVAPDQEAVRTMAFSPDGTVLAISTFGGDGGRGRLVFWNARPAPPLSGFTSD